MKFILIEVKNSKKVSQFLFMKADFLGVMIFQIKIAKNYWCCERQIRNTNFNIGVAAATPATPPMSAPDPNHPPKRKCAP